jgi:hypothetical protein
MNLQQAKLPPDKRKSNSGIIDNIMSAIAWRKINTRSKLTRIQTQQWNQPHCSAFISSPNAIFCHKWIIGLLPSMLPTHCSNCQGAYLISRFHACICSNVLRHLYQLYDLDKHLQFILEIDNPVDSILQLQLATKDFTALQINTNKIGRAIKIMMQICNPA